MKVGVGLIGCGYWGPHFIRVAGENLLSNLIRVCDTDESRVKECRKLFPGIAFTTSVNSIINDPQIKAVIISTPVITHFTIARRCLEAGKHVLCEKPLTYKSKEAEELVALAKRKKLVLMPGHVFEFNSVVKYMQRFIAAGKLGKVVYINMFRTGLGPIRNDVNVVYDLASHDVSILSFLLGMAPESVTAFGRSFVSRQHEDVAIISFEFPRKIIAMLTVSWMDPIKQRIIKVVGTRSMLLFNDVSTTEKLKIINTGKNYQSLRGDFGNFQLSIKDGDIIIPNIKYPEPLKLEYEHFIDCIIKGKLPVTDGRSGLSVVKILEAICDSMIRGGKKIRIK